MITTAATELAIYEAVWRVTRTLRVLCAWCPGFKPTGTGQSHGICKSCAKKMEEEAACGLGL